MSLLEAGWPAEMVAPQLDPHEEDFKAWLASELAALEDETRWGPDISGDPQGYLKSTLDFDEGERGV